VVMAGDWIPVDMATPRKREVLSISATSGKSRQEVVGWLVEFWSWFSSEAETPVLSGVTVEMLPDVIGGDITLWNAVVNEGWIIAHEKAIEVPNAERWLLNGAKARLKKNRRQSLWRSNNGTNVDGDVDGPSSTDPSLKTSTTVQYSICKTPIVPKSSESTDKPTPLESLNGFDTFWRLYPKRVAKHRAQKAWKKVLPAEYEPIMAALEKQVKCVEWAKDGGQYIPLPASWLNGRRWEDEAFTPIASRNGREFVH